MISGNKMKVEIWSDVVCPFCYIGKRRFESAMKQFEHASQVEIEWKSFQLSPNTATDPDININQMLAAHKGIPVEQAMQLNDQVTQMAAQDGLEYHFDKAVVANTFNAHRFLHFAKAAGKQHEAKERLLRAYFTEGKNIDDYPTLLSIGEEIGLDKPSLERSLNEGSYADQVRSDIREAQQLGIRGVPFFVFDRKYGVSGAQNTTVFLQSLEKAFLEWREKHPEERLEVIEGQSCSTDEGCE